MNEDTKELLGEVNMAIYMADELPAGRRAAALRSLLNHVRTRNVSMICRAQADQIDLTDEQWTDVERTVSQALGGAHAEDGPDETWQTGTRQRFAQTDDHE